MHKHIIYVADRAARREVEALHDFFGVGQLITSGEVTYEVARDDMVQAFKDRGLTASTAKVYVSQGYCLAQLFDTFADVETFADDECNGSRSLKRIYDATRSTDTADGEGEGDVAEVATVKALVDVVLAGLANLTDAAEIARVRDAAIAMLTVAKAA